MRHRITRRDGLHIAKGGEVEVSTMPLSLGHDLAAALKSPRTAHVFGNPEHLRPESSFIEFEAHGDATASQSTFIVPPN